MDNTSPNSGQPRKKRDPFDDDRVVDFVLDDSNSSRQITPRSPEDLRISERLRDRYLAWEAEAEEIKRQERESSEKPHPDPSADSSASGPTSGS